LGVVSSPKPHALDTSFHPATILTMVQSNGRIRNLTVAQMGVAPRLDPGRKSSRTNSRIRPGKKRLCLLLLAAAALSGCRSSGSVNTVAKLAGALKKEGLAWDALVPIERGRVRAKATVVEALELAGDSLLVEVYRIEDKKYFKTAALGLLLRAGLEPEQSENALRDVCVRQPFLLAVVEEPEERAVRRALDRVFPGSGGKAD
jgi:hypothetical protein